MWPRRLKQKGTNYYIMRIIDLKQGAELFICGHDLHILYVSTKDAKNKLTSTTFGHPKSLFLAGQIKTLTTSN